ncbi:MMPL family transporter [Demequina aurantiaca]|uniref:MMPL family transporter n=1 Tax=Demequina aurantiaca TaxID=676200 RepID=UPI00078349DB|nr:MMPL family transporter [Demequina aurantiaca]
MTSTKKTWWRPVAIVVMIMAWLAISGVGGSTFGKLGSVQENDAAAFLPASAESTEAAALHQEFVPSDTIPGLFVVDGIANDSDIGDVEAFAKEAGETPIEGDPEDRTVNDILVAPPTVVPSEDGEAVLVAFNLGAEKFSENIGEETLGEAFASTVRDVWTEQDLDLNGYLTGPVGLTADLVAAFAGIDGILLLVALAVVLIILLIVYRSPVLPFAVLMTAMIALTAAIIAVYAMANADIITLNGQSQGIMFILVVGATTDYALLLVARYREELQRHQSPYEAMSVAWRRSLAPIAASAGTVVLGLLVLLLSDLKSNASLGPAGAIGIVAAFVAALTLLPALLLIGGKHARGVFWPKRPVYTGDSSDDEDSIEAVEKRAGVWGRVSRAVDARPRRTWIGAGAVLLLMSAGLFGLKADGLGSSDVFTGEVESTTGFDVLEAHFDAGQSSPIRVFVPEADADEALEAVQGVDGVTAAYPLTESVAQGAPPMGGGEPPIVVDGMVEIDAVTEVASASAEATDTVQAVRDAVHPISDQALVGGEAAENLDTKLTTDRDITVIIPVILLVIFVVLMILLRAILTPLLIVLANILSFAAALGLSSVLFNTVFGFPGMDPATPLLGFVFLVALGVDYSIFLMSRAREESLKHGTREGVRRALAVTGGVITSAGIVLAATFAALGVIPLIFLAQIAVIVGLGVLIDTLIVRSLLVPGLVSDIGRASWWPWQRSIEN